MKNYFLHIALFLFSFPNLSAQSVNITVINGYGSGIYQTGDTVHVWSETYDTTKTFFQWSGDTQFLENYHEWHTTLIAPNQNVTISATLKNMPSYSIIHEQIMGKNNLKNVYSCFPSFSKGVIYLFHGTSGNAANWINFIEYRSFIDAAIADSFGIIVTEAEEITLNTDLNGDGKLRWQSLPFDSVNGVDFANIKCITDTFIARGAISNSTPVFSVGMSNGGFFSSSSSYLFKFDAGVSYCAPGAQAVFNVRNNPFAFRMAQYDNNAEVGPLGNYEAWQNDSTLENRNVCHDYLIHNNQPIYPERFARISGISVSTSQAVFNELAVNNQIDAENYALPSDSIKTHVLANPTNYPIISSLSLLNQRYLLDQIAASNAEHQFYSDYNFETLRFLNNPCSSTASIDEFFVNENELTLYPNPTSSSFTLNSQTGTRIESLFIYSISGQLIDEISSINDVSYTYQHFLEKGTYLLLIRTDKNEVFHNKIVVL